MSNPAPSCKLFPVTISAVSSKIVHLRLPPLPLLITLITLAMVLLMGNNQDSLLLPLGMRVRPNLSCFLPYEYADCPFDSQLLSVTEIERSVCSLHLCSYLFFSLPVCLHSSLPPYSYGRSQEKRARLRGDARGLAREWIRLPKYRDS